MKNREINIVKLGKLWVLYMVYRKQWFFLRKRFFESFSGQNIVNGCVKNTRVCFDSNILQLISYKVIRTVRLLSLNIGQCRRKWEVYSILAPQLQSGFKQFWKLKLNFFPLKWFNSRPRRVISLIPLRFAQLKTTSSYIWFASKSLIY